MSAEDLVRSVYDVLLNLRTKFGDLARPYIFRPVLVPVSSTSIYFELKGSMSQLPTRLYSTTC